MKASQLQSAAAQLDEINPVLFRYLSEEKKQVLKKRLDENCRLLLNEIDEKEAKTEQQKKAHRLYWMLEHYRLLQALLANADTANDTAAWDSQVNAYLCYHQNQVEIQGSYFRRHYNAFREDSVKATVDFLTSSNNFRLLQVVWGLATLEFTLRLFADTLTKNKVLADLAAVGDVLGNISWILYYIRLILTIIRMIMSEPTEDEKKNNTPWYKREAIQALKYPLLNDIFWGTTNLLCFMCFVGSVSMDYVNGIATAALLTVDLILNICRVLEENARAKHLINKLKTEHENAEALEEAEKKMALNYAIWDYYFLKQKGVWDITYAAGLVITWSAMCAFFVNTPAAITAALALSSSAGLPIALANIAIFNLVGAIGCFAISIIYNIASSLVDIAKAEKFITLYRDDADLLVQKFITIKANTDMTAKDKEMALEELYIKMDALLNQSHEQKRTAAFQKGNLARAIIFDLIIPSFLIALVIAVPPMVFGVIPVLFVLLGSGLALSAASKPAYESLFKYFWKKNAPLPKLEARTNRYNTFKDAPSLKTLESSRATTLCKPTTSRLSGFRNCFLASKKTSNGNTLPAVAATASC